MLLGCLYHAFDTAFYLIPFTGTGIAVVHNHVDLRHTGRCVELCQSCLSLCGAVAMGEVQYTADLGVGSLAHFYRKSNIAGTYTYGVGITCDAVLNSLLYLILGHVRFQNCGIKISTDFHNVFLLFINSVTSSLSGRDGSEPCFDAVSAPAALAYRRAS